MMEQHLMLLRTPAKPAMAGTGATSVLKHFNAEGLSEQKADFWRVARLMGRTNTVAKPKPKPAAKIVKPPAKHLKNGCLQN